jgi:hypothetical protein
MCTAARAVVRSLIHSRSWSDRSRVLTQFCVLNIVAHAIARLSTPVRFLLS